MYVGTINTELGPIWIGVSEKGLVRVSIGKKIDGKLDQKITEPYLKQIGEFLAQKRILFDLPIDWQVLSSFQQKVLTKVYKVPYGKTAAYKDIAKAIGKPQAARAIGRANATNPMPLVIPCHRIISSDGSLKGYSAGEGLTTKQWLLDLENVKSY